MPGVVRLFYDEALDSRSSPAASAFTVDVEGSSRTPTTASIETNPDSVALGLALPIKPGETVTVSYAKPSTNPLQDAAGNDSAAFTDFPVVNDLAAATRMRRRTYRRRRGRTRAR